MIIHHDIYFRQRPPILPFLVNKNSLLSINVSKLYRVPIVLRLKVLLEEYRLSFSLYLSPGYLVKMYNLWQHLNVQDIDKSLPFHKNRKKVYQKRN